MELNQQKRNFDDIKVNDVVIVDGEFYFVLKRACTLLHNHEYLKVRNVRASTYDSSISTTDMMLYANDKENQKLYTLRIIKREDKDED
jgi:prophage antirepressor-like protein